MRPGIFASKPIKRLDRHDLSVIQAILLIALAAVLFAGSFPNELITWGAWPLAYVALAPLFIVINRSRPLLLLPYGFLFGALAYGLFNYWLASYHPLAMLIVLPIYGFYFMVALPLLRLSSQALPRAGWLPQAILWVGLEYLKTLGFLGYPYGIMGYTQFTVPWLIQSAAAFGVWGISLIVVLPATIIAYFWSSSPVALISHHRWQFGRPALTSGSIWLASLIGLATVGYLNGGDYHQDRHLRIALVQQNMDPWLGGTPTYRQNLTALEQLSHQAIADKPDLVVWSETAFVPAITYHLRYREDEERYALVQDLLAFLKQQAIPFVFGTDDGERPEGSLERRDYNAAILYQDGVIRDTYRKIKLVPFSESFPFKKLLPGIYQWLEDNRTTFWQPGIAPTVFTLRDGTKFSTPICFEDSFGWLNREFVNQGAALLVNLTNDSWSASRSAAMQHLAMAAFRAAETGRTMVRATNGGITALITPNGQVTKTLPAFTPGFLTVDAPLHAGQKTWYLQFGDWFGQLMLIGGTLWLFGGILRLTACPRTPNIGSKDSDR
jgi:apolipoprotein N-acyltransferase